MNRKAFTLIELLAVIIILGILMLIAIPSVTGYINNSRKETYVSTIKELIRGASTLVNDGTIDVYDKDTTYYIPASAIKLESGKAQSPYGEIDEAYIVVTYDGEKYEYFYIGKDDADIGVRNIKREDLLNKDSIETDIDEISTDIGIDKRHKIVVFNDNGEGIKVEKNVEERVDGKTGETTKIICKRATSLHSELCTQDSTAYCRGDGYDLNETIIYGNENITLGELNTGDAFDCKVSKNGGYNERFYYVSDYFDVNATEPSFDSRYAVLVYYTPYYNESLGHRDLPYAIKSSAQAVNPNVTEDEPNYVGPVSTYQNLPSSSEWNNVSLINANRAILSEYLSTHNSHYANGKSLPTSFSYEGKAARLLTAQEFMNGCGLEEIGNLINGEITKKCNFLFEGTKYSDNSKGVFGVWLETPHATKSRFAWSISNGGRYIYNSTTVDHTYGTYPAIEISKDSIDY